jgi:DNA-binding response OmpR family regulator
MTVTNTPHVLLVEDEHRLQRTLLRSLEARHFRVDAASTAADALSAALVGDYDLLLLDVNLPDATGWDVLRDLRAAGIETPVIVVSAVAPNPARISELKPHGVLLKPFPIDALLTLIHAALGDLVDEQDGARHQEAIS